MKKFQNILSLSPNYCGPSRDTKTSIFFHTVFHDATLDEAWTVPIVLPKKIENKRKKTGQILI